jgi:peptidoglycan hydrolase CwlO-like protein
MIKLQNLKTKMIKTKIIRKRFSSSVLLLVGSVMTFGIVSSPIVSADQYTQQIAALQAQNGQVSADISSLQSQALSYEAEISLLQSQIASLQNQIASTQNNIAAVQAQIAANQVKLTQEKATLDSIIKSMYVDGNLSTLEMLATSSDLSQFVTKEEYQNIVQNQIQGTLAAINQTQATLKQQTIQLNNSLANLQTVNNQLTASQAQEGNLLSYNQTQVATYNQQQQNNNSKISQLQTEEIAANQSGVDKTLLSGGVCGGSVDGINNTYPEKLCDIPQDSVVDPWNMLNRECVSYTAWMESQRSSVAEQLLTEYRFGNATDWPANAVRYGAADGVTVSSTPQAGDVAIRPAVPGISGDVGHAMYVEGIVNSTTILVSEYNENYNGEWSVQTRSIDSLYDGYQDNLVFINFPS